MDERQTEKIRDDEIAVMYVMSNNCFNSTSKRQEKEK